MKKNEPKTDKGLRIAVQHKKAVRTGFHETAGKMALSEDFTDRLMKRINQQDDKPKQQHYGWMKIAASFIGVLLVSGIAFAAIHIVRSVVGGDLKSPTQETRISNSHQPIVPADTLTTDTIAPQPIVFEDTELATMLSEIATFYQCEVVFESEATKHVRLYFTWDKKASIDDIIGTFNKFERIHIIRENKKLIVE